MLVQQHIDETCGYGKGFPAVQCVEPSSFHTNVNGFPPAAVPRTSSPSKSHCRQAGGYAPDNVLVGFEGDGAADDSLSQPPESPLLGFAMDGRRLYGPFDSTGSLARGLDVCNGRWEKQVEDNDDDVSSGADENGTVQAYTYRASPSFPYLIGCWGPAGVALDAALAVTAPEGNVSESGDYSYSEVEGGFNLEVPEDGCPAGSFLNLESGECEACRAGTYGKDAGLVGLNCPGVSHVFTAGCWWLGLSPPMKANRVFAFRCNRKRSRLYELDSEL